MTMTDADHGITAADVAGENLTVTVWAKEDGSGYFWELWESNPVGFDGFGRIVWGEECITGGMEGTRELAEAAGEKAKESYIRDLIWK